MPGTAGLGQYEGKAPAIACQLFVFDTAIVLILACSCLLLLLASFPHTLAQFVLHWDLQGVWDHHCYLWITDTRFYSSGYYHYYCNVGQHIPHLGRQGLLCLWQTEEVGCRGLAHVFVLMVARVLVIVNFKLELGVYYRYPIN